jgi:GT2 family glycosyltransferase
MATHDRPERLERALSALRAQTFPADRFELIVVDDGSGPETAALLARESARTEPPALRVIRRDVSGGPAAARNTGWRAARAPLVAFTDDDCEATPGWLEAGVAACRARPGSFVQGPTSAIPSEWERFGPFSHTMDVRRLGPAFETANIFYPRDLLERLGGFDEQAYKRSGEDMDLAWRAIESGVEPVWAPDAQMHHAVEDLGPIGMLRRAWKWDESMRPFKLYPGLRRHRHLGVFWGVVHLWLFRAMLAVLVPQRFWYLRWWLAAPYVMRLTDRRSGPLLAPLFIARDLIEVATCIRGAVRYRVVML